MQYNLTIPGRLPGLWAAKSRSYGNTAIRDRRGKHADGGT